MARVFFQGHLVWGLAFEISWRKSCPKTQFYICSLEGHSEGRMGGSSVLRLWLQLMLSCLPDS